jgi:hypothetical protein
MSQLRLLRFAPLAAIAMASGAQACMDGSEVMRYFSYQRPVRHGDSVMLRVQVTNIEENAARAQLVGPFDRLSTDGFVRIDFADPPVGTNCVETGPTDGPVFVIGTLVRTQSGRLVLEAIPTRPLPRPRMHSNAELDSYIVDPSYLRPAPKRRHKVAP